MTTALRKRRWHALSGAVALGAFLVLHVFTQASALFGGEAYESVAGSIQRSIVLPVLEIALVYVPLAYHAGYGLWMTWTKKPGAVAFPEVHERLQLLQRVSGALVLVFVLAHLWEFRIQKWLFGMSTDVFYTKLAEHLSWTWLGIPWIALGYLAGLAVTVFHFCYGLAQGAVTWSVVTTRNGQRRASVAAAALAAILFLVGTGAILGISTGTRLLSSPDRGKSGNCGPASPPASAR